MTHSNVLFDYLKIITGKKLDALNLACEMMMFSFGEYELHAQCLTRIIKDSDILVTTSDYQSWDEECGKNNDEWYFVQQYREHIAGGTVTEVKVSPYNDVSIVLDNGIRIELFISNGYHHYGEENEQWAFFKRHDDGWPFIRVMSKSVDISYEWLHKKEE